VISANAAAGRGGNILLDSNYFFGSGIESLPEPQVDELAAWLEKFRAWRATPPPVEIWLSHAVGAAKPGVTTADVMALTRGEVSCRLARAVSL
jgi:hypothetical protein